MIIAIAVIVASWRRPRRGGVARPADASPAAARRQAPPAPAVDYAPGVGDDADRAARRADPARSRTSTGPDDPPAPEVDEPSRAARRPALERPESAGGRLLRLRARLARSNSALGQGLLALLSRDQLDEETWEEIEDTLLTADLGVDADHRARRRAAHPGQGRGHAPTRPPCAAGCARSCSPSSTRRWTARIASAARRRPPGRRARRRRQRHRQDHHRRQARPGPRRRGQGRRARRGRHLPRRRRRPAADLGRAGRRADRPLRPRGRRPGQRRLRRRQGRRRARRPTSCSSTPPAGCRTRSA